MVCDCTTSFEVWCHLTPQRLMRNFFSTPVKEWLKERLCDKGSNARANGWPEKFLITCWYLWRWRNVEIFTKKVFLLSVRLELINSNGGRNLACLGHR